MTHFRLTHAKKVPIVIKTKITEPSAYRIEVVGKFQKSIQINSKCLMAVQIPKQVVVWKFSGKTGNLVSNNNYVNNQGLNLRCTANKNKYLIWAKQPIGINLDWSTTKQNKYHFQLKDKKEREILTGEPFALGIGLGEAFLKYAQRDVGINLKWSTEPVYEWVIFGPTGEKGKPIKMNSEVAIINKKVDDTGDFLVYFDRPMPGTADVGWTTSPDISDWLKKAIGYAWDRKATVAALFL